MTRPSVLVCLALVAGLLLPAPTALAASAPIVVDTTGDGTDPSPGDGVCGAGAGTCSLRAAIQEANARAGADGITFNITPPGSKTITPASGLPSITDGLVLDATTQPGFGSSPIIALAGNNLESGESGLVLAASDSIVRGFVINRFPSNGILVSGGGNEVAGNYIGTDLAGSSVFSNSGTGVFVSGSGNRIGGTVAADRNVISGNADGIRLSGAAAGANIVQGNHIGTNAAGDAALPNRNNGLFVTAPNSVIGGAVAGGGNLISGNRQRGILLIGGTDDSVIAGNLIGTNKAGLADLGNGRDGIAISTVAGGTSLRVAIGGTAPLARNVISGNGPNVSGDVGPSNGILLEGSGTMGTQVAGNIIGLNAAGTTALGNNEDGVNIRNVAFGVAVGLGTPEGRNVISGNSRAGVRVETATAALINGNYIGLDPTGVTAMGNASDGVLVSGANSVVIGHGDAGEGNVISGNAGRGIQTFGSTGTVIKGNFVGTDASGTLDRGNSLVGMSLDGGSSTTVGGTAPSEANVISGNNSHGVEIVEAAGITLSGNLIGTDAGGAGPLGNIGAGIHMLAPGDNTIGGTAPGAGNTIAFNTSGILMEFGSTVAFMRNRIFSNSGLGIDLVAGVTGVTPNDVGDGDSGPNGLQNFPLITSVASAAASVTVGGTLNSNASQSFEVDVFASLTCDGSGNGEGHQYMGSVTTSTGGAGNASFSKTFGTHVRGGWSISATARNTATGATSEFSPCFKVPFAHTFTVATTGDEPDGNTGDNVCDGAGGCTLRAAIQQANASSGEDLITFNIGAAVAGPLGSVPAKVITPGTPLPTVTGSVTIDATTQPGYGFPVVELVGTATNGAGLTITASNSSVRGLAINRFDTGISLSGGSKNVLARNHIGTDQYGTIDRGNGTGIEVRDSSGNLIGGLLPGERNVVSGNDGDGVYIVGASSTGNTVAGNFIGIGSNGAALGNTFNGVLVSTGGSNTIGGATTAARNVISANGQGGVAFLGGSSNNLLAGNFIGTNAAGTAAIGNLLGGVYLHEGSSGNTIGGVTGPARNVISGNGRNGVDPQAGVVVDGRATAITGNVVSGNRIGTNAAGSAALPNHGPGVRLMGADSTMVGGPTLGAGNLISGNTGPGVLVSGGSATEVFGNVIGLDAAGRTKVGNDVGVQVTDGPVTLGGSQPGARNVVSGNPSGGVLVVGAGAAGSVVSGNHIGTDPSGRVGLSNANFGVMLNLAPSVTVGGDAPGEGNLISGNLGSGVVVAGAQSTADVVSGNVIGFDPSGTAALGNLGFGVEVLSSVGGTRVGGPTAAEGNLIGWSFDYGIALLGHDSIVQGNRIGIDALGAGQAPNSEGGIYVSGTGSVIGGATPAERNVVAFNLGSGIRVATGDGNGIRGNAVFGNGGLGIDLDPAGVTANDGGDGDTGANLRQNFPVLSGAGVAGSTTTVTGTLNSKPNRSYALDFFASASCDSSGNGEGGRYLGSGTVALGASNTASFTVNLPVPAVSGEVITTTATDPNGNTSEFSKCRAQGPVANVKILMTDSPDPVPQGQNLTYKIKVTNLGPAEASVLKAKDTIPAGANLVSASSPGAQCQTGATVTCTIAQLPVNQTVTITVLVTPTQTGPLVNKATVTAAEVDPNPANNQAQAITQVT